MCDCTSEEDDKPKIKPIDNNVNSCDCTSEESSKSKIECYNVPTISVGKLKSNKIDSCDCTSEESSKSKIECYNVPKISVGKLKSNKIDSCDCTSEDSSKSKIECYNVPTISIGKLKSNKIDSCDCTSDDDSNSSDTTTKSCDCTSESEKKSVVCDENDVDQVDSKPPFAILQVELSKSVLDLLSSSSDSSTSCDCTTSTSKDTRSNPTCLSSKETSCDCTSESDTSQESYERVKKVECTLAIIKPEAVMFRKQIERIIDKEGFSVCQTRWLQLTAEQASEFYRDNDDEHPNFARLVAYMSSKPIFILVLSKLDAIREWRLLIGPTRVKDARIYAPDSIRAKYGMRSDNDEDMRNAVHGSFDEKAAEREIHFFFPDYIVNEPTLGCSAVDEQYLWKNLNAVLAKGLVKCCEVKPEDPILWLGNWLLDNESTRPKYLLRS